VSAFAIGAQHTHRAFGLLATRQRSVVLFANEVFARGRSASGLQIDLTRLERAARVRLARVQIQTVRVQNVRIVFADWLTQFHRAVLAFGALEAGTLLQAIDLFHGLGVEPNDPAVALGHAETAVFRGAHANRVRLAGAVDFRVTRVVGAAADDGITVHFVGHTNRGPFGVDFAMPTLATLQIVAHFLVM